MELVARFACLAALALSPACERQDPRADEESCPALDDAGPPPPRAVTPQAPRADQTSRGRAAYDAALAWNGTDYTLVWADARDNDDARNELYFRRLSADGELLGPPQRLTTSPARRTNTRPALVFDGHGYGLAWQSHVNHQAQTIHFGRLSPEGAFVDAPHAMTGARWYGQSEPALAFAPGEGYGVFWFESVAVNDFTTETSLRYAAFEGSGALHLGPITLTDKTELVGGNAVTAVHSQGRFRVVWSPSWYASRYADVGFDADMGPTRTLYDDPGQSSRRLYSNVLVPTESGLGWLAKRRSGLWFGGLSLDGEITLEPKRVVAGRSNAKRPAKLAWDGVGFSIAWTNYPHDRALHFTQISTDGAPRGPAVELADKVQRADAIAAAEDHIAVAWTRSLGVDRSEVWVTRLSRDGRVLGPDLRVAP